MTDHPLVYRGRIWKFGDHLSSDRLIAANHVFDYDPKLLRQHLLEDERPALAQSAQPGDIVLAGRRFAHGSQHSHPFIAMKEMGLGLLTVAPTRAPFRLAVYMGVPLLDIGAAIHEQLTDGDDIEVDFARGVVRVAKTAQTFKAEPLPGFLLDIVCAGGGLAYMGRNAAQSESTLLQD